MREYLTSKEFETYKFLKNLGVYEGTVTDLAKLMNVDKSNLRKRLIELEKKGYIIRNGTKITLREE